MDGAWAAAIPVVGGITSSLINNASVDSSNAANRQFQEEQQDKQNEYNQRMWNLQNDYNTPAHIMARYSAAGLNPNLIYGSATGNLASPVAQSAKVDYVQQPHPAIDGARIAGGAVDAYNSFRLTSAQTNNLQAQATNTAEDTSLKQLTQLIMALKSPSEIGLNQSTTTKNLADAANANASSTLAPYSMELMKANTRKADSETQMTIDSNVRAATLQAFTLRQAIQNLANSKIEYAKSAQEIEQIKANTQAILSSKALTDADTYFRQQGMFPHDSVPMRWLQGLSNAIGSTTGDTRSFIHGALGFGLGAMAPVLDYFKRR